MTSTRAHSVLIVEDEGIVAKDLEQTLLGMGYDVLAITASADEAIARASERCPDVVLMDIRLKGKRDGIEAAEILSRRYGIPVVYLTAHADDATIDRAKETEPYGYLLKPVNAAELRGAIEIALHKHRMEKLLREREHWFSTTLRSIADAVVTVDLAGKVTFMNPAAEKLTGVALDDALGRPARDVVRLLGGAEAASPLDQALAERKTVTVREAALQQSPGGSLIISDSAALVADEEKVLGAVMVFRDVTEQKLLQKQLELSDRLASLGTMAAGVAHEVNNPLAVVVANASLVHRELKLLLEEAEGRSASDDRLERLEDMLAAQSDIGAAASRIGRIIADLQQFARPEPRTPGEADVGRSIDWAIRSTSHELRHLARVTADVADVPPVAMDEIRLSQIVVNLLLNAAQAITPGKLAANRVSVSGRLAEDGRVVVEVADTGAGMSPEILKHVFEPFFTTKLVGAGSGLGLAICRGIVTSIGGEIRVESQVGVGSVFRVFLPVAAGAGKTAGAAPSPEAPLQGRRGHILVIDDEQLVRRAIGRILEAHEVTCVESAREALALLASGKVYDIIFSDLMMPDMTGMDLYEELLRTRPEDARRVVFLSGGAMSSRVVDFLGAVPNLSMQKPFGVDELRTTVQRLLAQLDQPAPTDPRQT